jgi:hypothetical protein
MSINIEQAKGAAQSDKVTSDLQAIYLYLSISISINSCEFGSLVSHLYEVLSNLQAHSMVHHQVIFNFSI